MSTITFNWSNSVVIKSVVILNIIHNILRGHFTLRCPILEAKRKFYFHQLFELLREHSKEQLLNTVREEQEKLMLCIMDCTNPIFNLDVKKELDLISEIEEITRNLTFDLHNC
jgi:hypothetical protein